MTVKQTGKISQTDINCGKKILARRLELGMSRELLAKHMGVTHQQLQKNEKGTNRVSVGRLQLIAKALNTPVSYFFEEPDCQGTPDYRLVKELVREFGRIKNIDVRHSLVNHIRTLGK